MSKQSLNSGAPAHLPPLRIQNSLLFQKISEALGLEPQSLSADVLQQHTARDTMSLSIMREILEFEKNADADAIVTATTSNGHAFALRYVRQVAPDLLVLEGIDDRNLDVRIVQHASQFNVMLSYSYDHNYELDEIPVIGFTVERAK